MMFFNSKLSSFGFNSEFKNLQICLTSFGLNFELKNSEFDLTPNKCNFGIDNIKIMNIVLNHLFKTKHVVILKCLQIIVLH